MDVAWDSLSEKEKQEYYKDYVKEVYDEFGDNAIPLPYEEWCKDCAECGWVLI